MNTNKQIKQRGAATLTMAVVLLVAITLVTMFTARTVLLETQLTAANYRTMQAVSAANYAMDLGVNYFDAGGFDQDGDTVIDTFFDANGDDSLTDDGDGIYEAGEEINFTDIQLELDTDIGIHTVFAQVAFDNAAGTRCVAAGSTPDLKNGVITATGFSDDREASRTITQCVGPLSLLQGDGPDMPLISKSQVAVTGTANIVNRYTNVNVWAGEPVIIGSSSSMATFIKNPASGTLTEAQLVDPEQGAGHNTQLVSNRNLGNGLDIIDNDPSLGNLTAENFFENFFQQDRASVENAAANIGQRYTDIDNAAGDSGLIWAEGDQNLGVDLGTITAPVIVIVNGDFRFTGNPTIYGVLYVVGEMTVSGTVDLIGTAIVEGDGVAAGSPAVQGNGTLNLIFWRGFLDGGDAPLPGFTAVISGSWRDW